MRLHYCCLRPPEAAVEAVEAAGHYCNDDYVELDDRENDFLCKDCGHNRLVIIS